jgi:hypothetical protein
MSTNGAKNYPFLRFMLVLFSLGGIVSTGMLTGNLIDTDGVSNLTWIALETGGSAAAHIANLKSISI